MPPAIPDKLPCESAQQLEQELSTLRDALSLEETEDTWDRIASALSRFGAVVKGGGYKYEKELVNGIKASSRPIVSAMNSERTRLSAAALDCLITIAPRVGLAFEVLVPLFVPHILRLATRTNKVYVTRSQAGLALILGYCHIPSIIPCLLAACKESKVVTGRAVAVECMLRCLNKWDWTEKEIKAKVCDVEEVIRVTGRDKDAGVRQTSRKVFEAYKTLFPDRVDAFTGPLTPVMRKYLDIKSERVVLKVKEQGQPPSAQDKRVPLPNKSELASSTSALSSTTTANARGPTHVRSASSHALVAPVSAASRSKPQTTRSMLPPASVPSRARTASQSQAPRPHLDHQSEQHTDHERQRVLSTASSNFSIKSAPPAHQPGYAHRPPVRLAASQSHKKVINSGMVASSGQARRVRRVVAIEPHPANRPDFPTVVHKAPVRPTPLGGTNPPQALKPTQVPGREPVDPIQSATGVVFPTSEPESAPAENVGRKGAQRVPKPVPPPPTATPAKGERPAMAMGDGKRESKPSIVRRAVPGAPAMGDNTKSEKPKEGFAPRRGGGLLQPTLSQLSKQKTLPSASGATVTVGAKGVITSLVSKRPIWGGGAKSNTSKVLPTSRVVSRSGVGKGPIAKQSDQTKPTEVSPALPVSPGGEMNTEAQNVSLSGSSTAPQVDEEQRQDAANSSEMTTDEAPETTRSSPESETASNEPQTDEIEATIQDASEDKPDVFTTQANPIPHTPPYPTADEESEEDELDAIEFTTGDVYDPAGVPIKTPGKVMNAATSVVPPERNPLAEVVLNE